MAAQRARSSRAPLRNSKPFFKGQRKQPTESRNTFYIHTLKRHFQLTNHANTPMIKSYFIYNLILSISQPASSAQKSSALGIRKASISLRLSNKIETNTTLKLIHLAYYSKQFIWLTAPSNEKAHT